MDFSALSSELQNIAGRYNGRDTDPAYSTTMYCEMFHKILQKTETEVHDYADQIVILWMTLSQLCNTANTLAPCPARNELYQDIFLQCAKTVLNIKWQNLAEDDQSKENFTETVKATHVQLVTTGFDRFSLLLHLMENPWTDPTLSEIMSGEADNDDDAVQEYIRKESSLILKLRVEMLMQENCEEFALNLCNTLMGHEVFVKDMDLRETQLKLLHKLNQMDKLQEVCEKIVCHDGVKLVLRLEQKESNQALSVRLIQLFLVQDWIKPEQKCCTQELLKLWIRHQYIADHNKEKFLDSVWAIAKLSLCTQQILLLVSGLHRECGNEMIQLYTDLCVYAVNVDKGCCEQQMLQGNMEGVKERQHAIAQTCRKLSALYNGLNPKISRISSLTAFSLDASLVNLCLVERMFNRKYCTHSKKECAACIKVFSSVTHCVGDVKVNPATLYEVERLLNMLRPYYLNPDLAWKELLPVCQKFMKERSQSSSLETKEETTPPKTPPKKKSDSKPKAKKSSAKKEMSVSPGNIKYYCDDNVSYLPKESVPKMKNKNFRMKLASASSCTQTPKPDDSKVKPHTVKPAATPSKASTVFEFDKQLYQYNFKGKPSDSGSSSSSSVVKEQMSPAGSELSNSFANNHPKTPTQIANLKCQAVGVDSLGQPVLVKLPISVSSPSTATISSSVSGVVGPSGARQRTMYIGDPTVLGLHTPNPNTGLHITGQGKIQKPKKRQPHSIGELLEATKIMPCSTSSNFSTAASNMTSPKPSSQHSLPTSADLLRAARDYNLTIVQKPVTPKPFHTQYSTADLLRATKNIPQKSKPELQSASNLQSAKDMVQATKAAFAASVLGFIPKPQSTILSEVSQGVGQTSLHSPASAGSVGTSGSELKPTKKPKAPRKPKAVIPGQVNQKAKTNQVNVSQCNSVQTTSNKTIIAHSYKTVDGSISFLSSNVAGASNTIPTLVNKINAQSQSPVRPPANSYQVITSDKSNHRPRIIPIRATGNSKFPPYSSAITSDALSPGQVVGANTTVTTSAGSITSTHAEHDMYNIFTKEKPVVKQSPTTAKIGGFRRPSADELQSIVDWLQTGTEDDKKKMQVQSPVSAHVTQEVVTTVPSTVQSRTPTSVVTPTVTSASSFVLSPAAVAPKTVSLTQEQLQKIMSGLSQRQKIKQKSPSNKMQQKKSLNKQLQQLLAQDIKIGNQLIGNRNNFVQQNPLQKSQGNEMIIQSSATQGNQLVKAPSSNESQLAQSPSSHANQLVQPSLTQGNQLVQPSSTQGNQLVQPSSTQGNQLVQPALTQGNQLVQPSSTQGNQLVQPSSAQGSQQVQQGNQLVQPSLTQENQLVQPSVTQGNQLVQPSLTQGNQLVQPSSTQGIQLVQPSVTQGSQQVQPSSAQGSQQVQPSSAQGNQLVQPTLPGIPLVQPSSSHANQLVQPLTSHESQLIQSSLTQENQLVQPLSSLENQLVQTATPGIQLVQQSMPTTPGIQTVQPLTSATQGNNLIQSSLTYGNPLVQSLTTPGIQLFQSSTHGSQLVQPSLTQGHQLVQSALPGIQLVQSSTLGDQLVQPTAFENQLVQSSITPGIQLVQSSPALGIQLLQSSMTDGSQLVQPTTSLGNQLVHTTFSTGIQPVQSTSSYGRQLSFNENLLVQASASQGYRAIQPAPTPENQAFQPIPSVGNQLSLGQENQAIQSPLTQGTPAAQPVLTMKNQPIQLSQNQEVVSGNPLIQSTIPGIYAGNQQLQPSQVQEVSDPLLTLGLPFVKPQLIAPALTLPVSSQVTVSQSLTSTDQVTSAIQTTSTTGIQQSLSFPSQFQISGSKSLTMSPNQSTTRVLELQYLGQINPPSKILHPKPPSEDSSLVLATTASGDQVSLPGKVLDHLPEMNIKAANEIQGLLKSKQPTFIPKTISSEDELNIPKMPLGTLKVVENPDLVSTLFGKNRNPSKLSIDNNHSVACGGSVEKTETSIGKQEQRGGECEPAVSSSSDYDGSVNNIQGNGSPTQTLPSHDSIVCNMPSTTKVPYPQNDKSAQKHTSTSQDHLESTNNEDTSFGGKVRDVPHALDNQTTCKTTTSEFTISSSSVTDKDVGHTDGVDTTFPVNSGEKVLETNLDNTETSPEKESDLSLGMVDGTTCPDSTTQITNSDGDAGNNLTVGNNQYSCDDNDVQPPANYTEEKNDEESTGGQVLDLFPVSDIEQATTDSLMLPTPKGDNLEGTILSMEEAMEKTPAIDPTERMTDVQEQEAPCSSSYDSDQTGLNVNPVETICPATNLSSSGMEESSMLIRKDNLEEDKSLTDFQKVKGLHSDASKLSSFGKKISEEIENTTNVMGSPSSLTTPSTEHVEKAPIPEKSKMASTEEMRVPSDVTVHTSGNAVTPVSTDKDSEKNEVLNAEECFVKADKEDTVKPIEDMSELVLNLDDALGESATLLSTPVVACVSTDPTQQMAEDNLTPELRNSVLPNRVEVQSLDRRDADDEKSNPEIQTVPSHDFKLDNIKDYQVTDKKSMESPPLLQDTPETEKHPEQEKEVSSDSLDMKEGVEDIEPENKQSLIINNPDLLEKDSIPNKAWENAFVSFIDNMGEKKMVKTDNSKVHIKPVFSRQDSSGSESSSRSVGSSLGSRGSHRSSLDEESSGTRILPLQRRENDVKRFEYFSYHSSSHKSNKKRLSGKSVTGLQIQALPEIKAKSKHTMKLVPAAESTEVQQPKEVVNKCIICCKVFRSVESLKCHVRNICRPIDSRPDSNLKDFEYSTTYSCHKCEKEVSKKEEMKAHVAECFKDDDVIQSLSFSTKYMCQMCGEFFTSKDDVHSHVSRLCSKVMSCRQQQQDRLDRKTELTAKPLSDMVESWYSNDETHTDDTTKEKVPEETHESEEKKTLGLDDLESEIFNESNNHSDADTKEESKSKVVLSKKRKHQVSNLTLPSKQWSLRNKTKFSSRLKGFEFFTNKLNPARRRTEQRKWHEDYHSLRNRVVKKKQ